MEDRTSRISIAAARRNLRRAAFGATDEEWDAIEDAALDFLHRYLRSTGTTATDHKKARLAIMVINRSQRSRVALLHPSGTRSLPGSGTDAAERPLIPRPARECFG